jgi:hypothetical protein
LDPVVMYGSADPDSDPHQNVTDPQHCLALIIFTSMCATCSVQFSVEPCYQEIILWEIAKLLTYPAAKFPARNLDSLMCIRVSIVSLIAQHKVGVIPP